jgi:hypothetical protein
MALGFAGLLAVAAWVWREDILRTALDPKQPFQTYRPPPAPDYAKQEAWALLPGPPPPGGPVVDVFFLHPTTFNGGRHWNAPVPLEAADRVLQRGMLPNYAGPYQQLGRVFAPRYRQASLYARLTLRDDARDARAFPYQDVRAAFHAYLARHGADRPFLIVGAEQGGFLAARLLAEEVAPNPAVRARFVGAHLIETVTPPVPGLPPCQSRTESGCVLAFASVPDGDQARARRLLDRALIWSGEGLEELGARPAVCVNPVTGGEGQSSAPTAALGSANATDLEWGARPAFLRHEVGAACRAGLLHVTRPTSPSLQGRGGWAERLRTPSFNLFYADLEADARVRLAAWRAQAR